MANGNNYYEDVTDRVLAAQLDLQSDADTWGADTIVRMNALAVAATTHLSILESVSFSPSFTDNLAYSGPGGTTPDYATEPDYSSDGPVAPTLSTPDAVAAFSFSDTSYTGLVKTLMVSTLNDVLGGSTLLPSAVIDAMYDRLVADLSREQVAEEWVGSDNGASRGWVLPEESTLNAVAVTQERTSVKLQGARLEAYIQEWVSKREDMLKAWISGVQLEQQWIGDHHQEQERGLKAAIAKVEQSIAIFANSLNHDNVKLAAYSAQWDTLSRRVQAAAQMFQARIANTGMTISSENARHGYEQTRVSKAISTEQGEVNLAIENAKLVVENSLGTLTSLMQVAANVSMALMAASDVSLGTGTSFGANETHSYAEKCCE